jgi:hypothetical protein
MWTERPRPALQVSAYVSGAKERCSGRPGEGAEE